MLLSTCRILTRRGLAHAVIMISMFFSGLGCYALTRGPEGLADGAGIWVNMWNYPRADFEGYCQNLHAKGIRNVFIQTSRSNTEAICHPAELGQLIDACHRYKIRIIAWSFAELSSPDADADRMIAAARFVSPKGQHMDALAANLEKNLGNQVVESYSKKVRDAVGINFPMIAVVYSPLNQAPQVARIPWKTLDKYYDVLAPMNYWNSKYKKLDPYEYTISTIHAIREKVGRGDVEIHMIGDGMGTHADSIYQFFKACRDAEATTASLYPNFKMTTEQMDCLAQYSSYFPVNARFRLAAFHQLVQRQSLPILGKSIDPSAPISRSEFYQLLAGQLYPDESSGLTLSKSLDLLSRAGAGKFLASGTSSNPEELEAICDSPICASEAFNLLAKLVGSNGKISPVGQATPVHSMAQTRAHKVRPDRWFVQPAYASEVKGNIPTGKPMNYLDAAQMVFEITNGLK